MGKDIANKENCKGFWENNFSDQQKKLKMSRKKFFSQGIAEQLFSTNPDSPLANSYHNTIFCSSVLVGRPLSSGVRYEAKRCKNRWCPLCQSIRIANLIRGYLPQIDNFAEPYFVTLTRPTVSYDELESQHKMMMASWGKIRQARPFRSHDWMGLHKRECTIRPDGKYHYHFHIIVNTKEAADFIVKRWLLLNPDSRPQGQDMRPVTTKGDFIDIFKYFTKLVVKNGKNERWMDYKRLDLVMQFMRGKRVFQPFGGLKAIPEDNDEPLLEISESDDIYPTIWRWATNDWVNPDTGEEFSGYVPSESIIKLICGE